MRKLALYGASGLGIWLFERHVSAASWTTYDEVIFVDDDPSARPFASIPLVDYPGLLRAASVSDVSVVVCVGDPEVRHGIAVRLLDAGLTLANLIDSEARISPRANIGRGCVVSGLSPIGPGARIGDNTLLLDATASRDAKAGASCVLDSGCILSRHSAVGDQVRIGVGAIVGEGVTIGAKGVVSMGAVVYDDVAPGRTVMGNLAKVVL